MRMRRVRRRDIAADPDLEVAMTVRGDDVGRACAAIRRARRAGGAVVPCIERVEQADRMARGERSQRRRAATERIGVESGELRQQQ
jgi:hypothetical protein